MEGTMKYRSLKDLYIKANWTELSNKVKDKRTYQELVALQAKAYYPLAFALAPLRDRSFASRLMT